MSKDKKAGQRATRQHSPTKIIVESTMQALKKWKRYSSG